MCGVARTVQLWFRQTNQPPSTERCLEKCAFQFTEAETKKRALQSTLVNQKKKLLCEFDVDPHKKAPFLRASQKVSCFVQHLFLPRKFLFFPSFFFFFPRQIKVSFIFLLIFCTLPCQPCLTGRSFFSQFCHFLLPRPPEKKCFQAEKGNYFAAVRWIPPHTKKIEKHSQTRSSMEQT